MRRTCMAFNTGTIPYRPKYPLNLTSRRFYGLSSLCNEKGDLQPCALPDCSVHTSRPQTPQGPTASGPPKTYRPPVQVAAAPEIRDLEAIEGEDKILGTSTEDSAQGN